MSTSTHSSADNMALHAETAQTKIQSLQEIIHANQNIEAIGPTPPSQVAFAEAFVYVKVYCNDQGFKLPSGAFAKFEGTAWGVAFGGASPG